MVSGAADVANNAIAELSHLKPIALEHKTPSPNQRGLHDRVMAEFSHALAQV